MIYTLIYKFEFDKPTFANTRFYVILHALLAALGTGMKMLELPELMYPSGISTRGKSTF